MACQGLIKRGKSAQKVNTTIFSTVPEIQCVCSCVCACHWHWLMAM